MEELNKQLLLDKFSKILDRAEEIAQDENFIKYKNKHLEYVNNAKTEINIEQLTLEYQKLCSKLKDSIRFDDRLDSTALMIAIAGNNWL